MQRDSQLAKEAPKTVRYLYENKRLAKELDEARAKVEEKEKELAILQKTLKYKKAQAKADVKIAEKKGQIALQEQFFETQDKLKALEQELDDLKREVALCQLCGTICTEESHAQKFKAVMGNNRKQEDYIRHLGKRERQTSLRSFFNKQSRKNEAGFDRPELVQ